MRHCDEEQLSLLALGEPGEPVTAEHLTSCGRCQAELAELREVVDAVRADSPGLQPVTPPASVWAGIAAATGVRVTPRNVEPPPAPAVPRPPSRPRRAGRRPAGRDVVPSRRSRGSRVRLLATAASFLAVGLVAGVGGTLWLRPAGTQVVAVKLLSSTQLSGLPLAPAAHGEADVVQASTGRRLTVDVSRLQAPAGYYEVWLIDRSVHKMFPIGVLHGAQGQFALPDGVDLGQFPIVDISVQPLNGDPRHSGHSVLRGTIPTA